MKTIKENVMEDFLKDAIKDFLEWQIIKNDEKEIKVKKVLNDLDKCIKDWREYQ